MLKRRDLCSVRVKDQTIASPINGITSPCPSHLGFTTPLSSCSRCNHNFSPFSSVTEIASSTGLEDTFYRTGMTVWDDIGPLGFNSASADNIPLQKRSFSTRPKQS